MLNHPACCSFRYMDTTIIQKKGLFYFSHDGTSIIRTKPWLGDFFSLFYDGIMERSVFPKKFGADINLHKDILRRELGNLSGKRIIELGTGSGNMSCILQPENRYTGIDISPRLLLTARRRFLKAGFTESTFYVAPADHLPFPEGSFDYCICNLSLNFFPDIRAVLTGLSRVMSKNAGFFISVPVPERIPSGSMVRGTLYSSTELGDLFRQWRFSFEELQDHNGAILYARGS